MQLLTKLGLGTGFSEEDFLTKIYLVSYGGLKFDLEVVDFEKIPRVIKSLFIAKSRVSVHEFQLKLY
jgi:hypothetical protein